MLCHSVWKQKKKYKYMYTCTCSNWWPTCITLILQAKIFKNGRKLLKEIYMNFQCIYVCSVIRQGTLNIYIVSLCPPDIVYKLMLEVHLRWTAVPSSGNRWLIRLTVPLKLGMSTCPINIYIYVPSLLGDVFYQLCAYKR